MIYGGPISPSFVYDPVAAKEVGDIVLFGDDFQGYCVGFDPGARWRVVEVGRSSKELRVMAPTFTRFLSRWLANRRFLVEQASESEEPPTKAVKKKRPTNKRKARKSSKK